MQPVLDVQARSRSHVFSSSRQAGGKRPPCVATPTSAVVGSKHSASSTERDDRDAALHLSGARRVEHATTGRSPVREHAARRLAVVRIPGEALRQDQQRSDCCDTETRLLGRNLDAVGERDSGPRILARAAGCRRGRRGRRAARRRSRRRSRAPTRSCSRASRRGRARVPRVPSAAPRGCRPTSRA